MNVMTSVFSAALKFHTPVPTIPVSNQMLETVTSSARYAPAMLVECPATDTIATEKKIEQVEAMGPQIEKEAGAADRRIDTPVRGVGAGQYRCGDLDMHRGDSADRAILQAIADGKKPRQRTSVKGDPQGQTARFECADHSKALGMIERHRLLDQTRLAGCRDVKRQCKVARGRRGDVDRIHLRVGNEIVGSVVGTRHSVPPRVVSRLFPVAAHDRHQRRTVCLLKSRAALDLGHVAAADDPPSNRAHLRQRYASSFWTTLPWTSVSRKSRPWNL